MNVPLHQQFLIKNGPPVKNLEELSRELARMSKEQFDHHVNDAKNDFYNWVYHVVKDESLALKLSSVRTKDAMSKLIAKHITELEKKASVRKTQTRADVLKRVEKIAGTTAKVVAKPIAKREPTLRSMPPAPELSGLLTLPPAPDLSVLRAPPPTPINRLPTLEDVEAMVQRKLATIDTTPLTETPLQTNAVDDDTKPALAHHLIPYAMGLMAGILAGLVIARFLV